MPKIHIKNRDKLIICGLFLSKFDDLAYKSLGFSSFIEAFNVLGFALQGKPSNIKNYRDEFDPYFDNARKGWYQRELRTYTKEIFEQYKDMRFESFKNLVSSFLIENYEEKLQVNEFLDSKIESNFIKRVATGKAAEQYFRANFMQYFKDFSLFDSRDFGCGFDFKMQNEKEYNVAQSLQDKYCLYIVSNLKEKPRENVFFNPIECFNFAKQSRQITQTSYQGSFNV